MADFFTLVADRTAFFANRVDAYARSRNLNSQEVVADLQQLSLIHGNEAISGIIDKHVPDELHSSRMPAIRKEVAL